MNRDKHPSVESFMWAPSRYDLRSRRVIGSVGPVVSRAATDLLNEYPFNELIRERDAHGLLPLTESAKVLVPAIVKEKAFFESDESIDPTEYLNVQYDFEELLYRLKQTDSVLNGELLKKTEVNKTRHDFHVHVRLGRCAIASTLRQEYDLNDSIRLQLSRLRDIGQTHPSSAQSRDLFPVAR